MTTLADPAAGDGPSAACGCPAGDAVATARLGGLDRFVRDAGNGRARIELLAPDVHCAACIQRLEGGLKATGGVEGARVNLSLRRATVTFDPARLAPQAIVDAMGRLGYQARPFDAAAMRDVERDEEGRDLLARLGVAGFAAANVMLLSVSVWSGAEDATRDLLHWISALIALPAVAFAGMPFFANALRALRAGRADMDIPISMAVLLAVGVSLYETALSGAHAYFDAAISLLFFLLIGRYLDHRTRRTARVAAAELCALQAHSATLVAGDARRVVAVEDLRPGDVIEVAAGERLPADGEVVSGRSDVDRSMLTGETAPEAASAGAAAHAGTLNISAPLQIRVSAAGDDTVLAGIARMIEEAESAKTRHARWADAAARAYVPTVHVAAALAFVVWLAVGATLRDATMIAAAVLIITCPCALALAVPAVHAAAGGRLFRAGVFLKDGAALEGLAAADTVVFDKTGTLTTGRPAMVAAPADPDARAVARALGQASRHPFAQALASAVDAPAARVEDVAERPGLGVEGVHDGRPVRLGRADWVGARDEGADGLSAVWLRVGEDAPVRFAFEDPLKPDAAEAVAALTARGLRVILLSGDAEGPVARAAAAAGIEDAEARCTPEGKLARIEALAAEGRRVLMVGDGINDAPALAAAAASMSPAEAADVSRAAAGLVFCGERLRPVVLAIDTARAARSRAQENFAFSALYNVVTVPLAAFGFVTPLIAALSMSGSSIVVTLNALRLRRQA